jgi:2-polyprenyl-3-methyl-5-hydroxy-6-metoxy-1,4-benzoquinol methylase
LNEDQPINYKQADWGDSDDDLGLFDLIIGIDLLYEEEHIELLANFIERHAQPSCEVILVDPGRGRKNKLTAKMVEFGFSSSHSQPAHTDYLEKGFKGHILTFER